MVSGHDSVRENRDRLTLMSDETTTGEHARMRANKGANEGLSNDSNIVTCRGEPSLLSKYTNGPHAYIDRIDETQRRLTEWHCI